MIEVYKTGHLKFPRYVILDKRKEYDNKLYWTGNEENPWTEDVDHAQKWASENLAFQGMNEVYRWLYRDIKEQRYTLNLDISLFGTDVTKEQLIFYLQKALDIRLDINNAGVGPVPGSIVFIEGHPSRIREAKIKTKRK